MSHIPLDLGDALIDNSAMFKLSYGLFVLTAKDGDKDNGCIINTAMQLTTDPVQILITVNKANFTHDMISSTGLFNLSVLSESAPFSLFEQFGFQCGRSIDKFANVDYDTRTPDGIRYIPTSTNCVISAKVVETLDCGSHSLFVAAVSRAFTLSDEPSVTYQYYFDHIKPKPDADKSKKSGYVCKICNYVYGGEPLPDDFICPLCKHGAADFEKIKGEITMKTYECVCGYVYEEAVGEPEQGIAPGTKWEDVPDDFTCPVCGVGKDMFS